MANEINIKLVVDGKEANATLSLTDEQLKQIARQAAKAGEDTTSQFAKIGNVVTGINQGLELARKGFDILSQPLEAAGQFEQYETSLKVMLGSTEAAKERLSELVEFAKTTPFELPQVVEAANKLQAIGRYSKENLTDLGDLSAAAGKPMEQALDAYAKLATGQKGIAVDMFRDLLITQQDWMDATGKGITKNGELLATTEEMLSALPEILRKKNFTGMMDEQSKTFNGQLSNLKDSIGQFETELGNMLLPVAKNLLGVLTPAVSGAKDHIGLLITVVETGTAAFVTYQLAVNGATVATKLMEAASLNVKKAIDAIKLAMASNPWGLALAGVAALGVALYNLNEEYGNTLDNQLKNAKAAEEANKQLQKETEKKIEDKEAVKKLAAEYETLNGKLKNGSLNAEERKNAEARLREILTKLKEQYPDLIKSTSDYSKELKNVKTAAGDAKDEIVTLHNELTSYQKDMVKLKIATGNSEVAQGFEDVYKEFRTLTIGGSNGLTMGSQEGEKQIKYLESLANDLSSGKKKISEVVKELGDELSKYSQAAASGGDNASYNLDKANKINELIRKLNELKNNYAKLNANVGIDATGNKNQNSNPITTPTSKEDSFAKNKQKTFAEIERENNLSLEKERAYNMDYMSLLDARAKKQEEFNGFLEKKDAVKNQNQLDSLNKDRAATEDSIKILDDEIKRREDLNSKEMDAWRTNKDKRFEEEQKHLDEMKQLQEEYYEAVKFLDESYMSFRLKKITEQYLLDLQAGLTYQQAEIGRKEALKQLENDYYEWKWQKYQEDHKIFAGVLDSMWAGYDTFFSTLFDKGMSGKDRLNAVWDAIKQAFIGTIAEMGKQYLQQLIVRELIGKGFEAAAIASAIGTGTAIASAYAPAAAFASIMTLGGAAIAGSTGLAATTALAYGLAIPKFSEGGLPKGKDAIVQVNEDGQEFIVNANATRRNLEILEAMNAGANLADMVSGSIAAEGLRNVSIPVIQTSGGSQGSAEGFKMLGDRMENSMKTLGDRLESVERVINVRDLDEQYNRYKAKENYIGN